MVFEDTPSRAAVSVFVKPSLTHCNTAIWREVNCAEPRALSWASWRPACPPSYRHMFMTEPCTSKVAKKPRRQQIVPPG